MAQFTVNAQRFDPYKNFKFRVKWDGRYVAGVSKVSALKRTTEVVKHREGGDPSSSRKSPGRTEYEAITLERGVTHDTEFEQWANKVWNFGAGPRRRSVAQGLPQGHHHRALQRGRPARASPTRSTAAGCRSSRRSPISTPTPTPSPSSTSSSRTRAGSATRASPNRASRRWRRSSSCARLRHDNCSMAGRLFAASRCRSGPLPWQRC